MAVPYTFATATSSIPLSQLDANFATGITLGNTTVYLGNTTTSIGNLTLTNATISSVASTFPNSYLANSSVTIGSTNVSLGGTATTIAGLTLTSPTITGGTSTATQNLANVTGTLAVGNGGTGLTTLTAGYIPYGNGTSAFSSSAGFTFDGTNLTLSTSQNSATKVNVSNANAGTSAVARYEASNGSNTAEFGIRGTAQTTNGILAPQVGYAYSPSAAGLGLVAAAGPIMFASNGTTEIARFSTAGYLGIGTSSPATKLDVNGSVTVGSTGASDYALIVKSTSATGIVGSQSAFSAWGGGIQSYPAINIGSTTNHPIVFGTNNTGVATLDASGNLGLGVTPSAWSVFKVMQLGSTMAIGGVNGTSSNVFANAYYDGSSYKYIGTGAAYRYEQNTPTGYHAWHIAASGSAGGPITFTQAMTLDNSGNLLVGTTSNSIGASNNLICSGVIASGAPTATGYTNVNSSQLEGSSGRSIINHISGASSGSLYIGFGYNGGGIGSITQSGTTAVLFNVTSDQRLKENIVDAPSGNIDDIKVRSFDWKSDGSHQEYGMVAQELVEVAPYAVHQPQDVEEMMAVDYSKLVPMMIKEIQDLKQRIATLENK